MKWKATHNRRSCDWITFSNEIDKHDCKPQGGGGGGGGGVGGREIKIDSRKYVLKE